MTRHKHADLIIQSVQDTTIEWEHKHDSDLSIGWFSGLGEPPWEECNKFRQKPKRHIHQDLIDIAKADPSIKWQYYSNLFERWEDCIPEWTPTGVYRQKTIEQIHQEMMDQAAVDPSIKWQHRLRKAVNEGREQWYDCSVGDPLGWYKNREYRQKPVQAVTIDMWQWAIKYPTHSIKASPTFHACKADAQKYYSEHEIACRIDGSKITVPVKS